MNESEWYAWVRARLPGYPVRIENAIGSGLPDCALLVHGTTVWIELKSHRQALLRPYQWSTINKMYNLGGVRTIVLHLDDPLIRFYRFPFEVAFNGKYHRITSKEDHAFDRNTFTREQISSVLKELSKV